MAPPWVFLIGVFLISSGFVHADTSNGTYSSQASSSPKPNDTTTPPANGTDSPKPNDTTTPPANGTNFTKPNDTTTPPANGTNFTKPNGTTTPPANGTDSPKPNDTTTPPANGTDSPKPNDTTTPPANGTDSPKPNGTTTPAANGTDSPKPNDTTTPPANGTDSPKPNDTTTPPANGTDSTKPNDTTTQATTKGASDGGTTTAHNTTAATPTVTKGVDECKNTSECQAHALCTKTPGGNRCTCDQGFEANGTICIDIDECKNKTLKCPSNSVCVNHQGNYSCDCDAGFEKNDTVCQDIDECKNKTLKCPSNSVCVNHPGNYSCDCDAGYEKNDTFCQDKDECRGNPCHVNAKCLNSVGNYSCECNDGYRGSGETCEDIDECEEDSFDCPRNSTCVNHQGNYSCKCNSGFKKNDSLKNDTFCQDINECSATPSPCDANANCTNVEGSFECTCHDGYEGDGKTCNDIDECKKNTFNCSANSKCVNNPGSYSCDCVKGFKKIGTLCHDIDECSAKVSPCGVNATCANLEGAFNCTCDEGFEGDGLTCKVIPICLKKPCSDYGDCQQTGVLEYTCYCRKGWKGKHCEEDVDECIGSPCSENSHCTNTNGSYTCKCKDGFENIGNGQCREMFVFRFKPNDKPYGEKYQLGPVKLPVPFPYFNDVFNTIYAYKNGYVSFGLEFQQTLGPDKANWPNYPPLVATHWTNMDFETNVGGLYVYQENRLGNLSAPGSLLTKVEEKLNDLNFKALAAIAFTWIDAHPYPSKYNPDDKLRAQVIFASDGFNTYMIRNYDVTWSDKGKDRRLRVSYTHSGASKEGTEEANIPSDGKGGRVTTKLFSSNIAAPLSFKCLNAIEDVKSSLGIPRPIFDACPCWNGQAKRNPGFKEDDSCYKKRFWSKDWKQTCCYDNSVGLLQKNVKDAKYPIAKNESLSFKTAYDSCCSGSSSYLCSMFYKEFPSDDCKGYIDRSGGGGGGFGDPHVINFDKEKFTFNILGDFILFKKGDVELQGKTEKSNFNTTFFTSFAIKIAKDSSPYIVKIDGTSLKGAWKNSSKKLDNDTVEIDESSTEISLIFPVGEVVSQIKFAKNPENVLKFEVQNIPAETEGIMGNNNKKTGDDFSTDGKTAEKLTGEEIQDFAEKCRLTKDSFFETFTSRVIELFVPPNPVAEVVEALKDKFGNKSADGIEKCQDDLFCLQDYYATGNLTSAEETKKEFFNLQKDTKALPSPVKAFTNSGNLTWDLSTKGTETITLNAPDALKYEMFSDLPGLKLVNETVTLNLTAHIKELRNLSYPIVLRFSAEGIENQMPQVYEPHLTLCLCDTQCTDQVSSGKDGNTQGNVFSLECKCEENKEGRYCQQKIDVCSKCAFPDLCNTSLPDPCPCLDGWEKDERGQCIEIDECHDGKHGGCEQICVNTIGSRNCTCREGFKEDELNCIDIEDCINPTLCSSSQYCEELPGGYECHCHPGLGGSQCIRAPYQYPGRFLLKNTWTAKLEDKTSEEYKNLTADLSKAMEDHLEEEGLKNLYVDIVDLTLVNGTNARRKKRSVVTGDDLIECSFVIHSQDVLKDEDSIFKEIPAGSVFNLGTYTLAKVPEMLNASEICNQQNKCDKATTGCHVDENNILACECKAGFKKNYADPYSCRDIDECETHPEYCEGFQCLNYPGNFTCKCPDNHKMDYTTNKCKENPNPCDNNNPCQNGGTCLGVKGTPTCSCAYGWEGKMCENKENKAKQMEVAVIATGSVLGALCLILIIIITALVCRMRRGSVDRPTWSHSDYATSQRIPRPKLSQSLKTANGSNTYESLNGDSDMVSSKPDYDDPIPRSSENVYHNKAYDNSDLERL